VAATEGLKGLRLEEFDREQHRHPGIVLGQLMYREEVAYRNMREMLVKVSPFLEEWVDVPYPTKDTASRSTRI
jgi:hypothetical protein